MLIFSCGVFGSGAVETLKYKKFILVSPLIFKFLFFPVINFPNMSSDENNRRFKPLSAVESSDQTTLNMREIHVEKHLSAKNSELTDIGQYLERGKRKLRELDCSQRVDRAMEAYQESYVEQISEGSSHHSEEGTPPRRQSESDHGQGSSSVDPSCGSQSQAAVVPNEVSQALREADVIRRDRDSLALDQIKNRGKIMELEKQIAELASMKSKADHPGDSRTHNGSPGSVSDVPKGQRFIESQSGDYFERFSREKHIQSASAGEEAVGPESGSVQIPADNDDFTATSGKMIKNIQEAFSVVFTELRSLRQSNESGMSKDAQPGSGHNSRQVSALSRSSGRKTYKESSNDLERPSSSNLRSNQFLPYDIHGDIGGMEEQFNDSE